MQQQVEYQEVGIQQLTQEGMGQLSAAGYGIAYQSVHNREILVFVRVAPQAIPAPQEPPQNNHQEEITPAETAVLEKIRRNADIHS